MKSFIQFLMKLLYPLRCGFCNAVILGDEEYLLCNTCHKNVKFIGEECCHKCGKGLINGYVNLCADCIIINHHFDRAFSAVEYRDEVKRALIRYKFFGRKRIINTLAELALSKTSYVENVDMIISVPLHQEKLMQRGFNQSEEIARYIAHKMGIELNTKSLIRIKNTKNQSSLHRKDRLKNLKEAFASSKNDELIGKTVLLVDDIYTTGSTVSECARILKEAGARKVYVLTVASGRGY